MLAAVADRRLATFLAGPGRGIVADGARSAWRRRPNMNTLVAGGAVASFFTGAAAMLLPGMDLGDSTMCFDEPVMLLAFVTLGRAMEMRARLRATSDLRAIAQLWATPAQAVALIGVPRHHLFFSLPLVLERNTRASRQISSQSSHIPPGRLCGARHVPTHFLRGVHNFWSLGG